MCAEFSENCCFWQVFPPHASSSSCYCHVTEMLACDWSASHYFNLSPSHLFSFMADGSVLANEIIFKCTFRAFPMQVQCSIQAK